MTSALSGVGTLSIHRVAVLVNGISVQVQGHSFGASIPKGLWKMRHRFRRQSADTLKH